MGRVFLSVLGTGDYVECIYKFDGDFESVPTRYVQEATVSRYCKDWGPNDKIIIFTTSDARDRNWNDHDYYDKIEKRSYQREGLETRLKSLGILAQITNIDIVEGKSVEEIWSIFQNIFDNLNEHDEIVFDITHSFRSIPMLVLVVLNYAKVLKKVNLTGIYYGAFEVLGPPHQARTIPLDERKAPIFDLTPFVELQDWSTAIDRFLKAGDASMAAELAKSSRGNLDITCASDLAEKMLQFTTSLSTCRGKNLATCARELRAAIAACENSNMPPTALSHLLTLIQDNLESFPDDEIRSGVAASRWCLDHNLIQQGITILQETVISFLCELAGLDHRNSECRKIAKCAVVCRKKPEDEWKNEAAKNPEVTRICIKAIQGSAQLMGFLGKELPRLDSYRNDIDHAGFTDQTHEPEKFKNALAKAIDAVSKIVQ
ncbi:MAG: TIGR02221 family CRISPR-associated protein [Desulfomonilaceae bacterium]